MKILGDGRYANVYSLLVLVFFLTGAAFLAAGLSGGIKRSHAGPLLKSCNNKSSSADVQIVDGPEESRKLALSPFTVVILNLEEPLSNVKAVKSLGADWVRLRISWDELEPRKGRFRWAKLDRILSLASRNDLGVYLRVIFKSRWAVKPKRGRAEGTPPKNPEEYGEFIYELVKHCKGKGRVIFALGTEMNAQYWQGTVDEYVDTLKAGYTAAKKADPGVRIATAAITGYQYFMIRELMSSGQKARADEVTGEYLEYWKKKGGFSPKHMPLDANLEELDRKLKEQKRVLDFLEDLAHKLVDPATAAYYDMLTVHGASSMVDMPYFFGWFDEAMKKQGINKMIYTEVGEAFPQLYDGAANIKSWKGEGIPKLYAIALAKGAALVGIGPLAWRPDDPEPPGGRSTRYAIHNSGLVTEDLSLTPAGHTFKRMTGILSGSTAVQALSSGPQTWVVKFTTKNENILVAWSDPPASSKIPIRAEKIKITNAVTGKSTTQKKSKKNGHTVTLDFTPVYIQRLAD